MRILPAIVLLSLTWTAMSRADEERRAHFQLGMELLAKSDYEGACAAFEKAEAKGPAIGSSYQLGRCNEGRGKYGLAYESYKRAAMLADSAGDGERASIARDRAAEMEPKAPKLLIVVPPDRAANGMTVRIDGKAVADWSGAAPIGEGSHRIEIGAQGRSSVAVAVEVRMQAEVVRVTVPELPPLASAAPPPDEEPEERRRNPALFWTGVGLTIGGGCALIAGLGILGNAEATADPTYSPAGIVLLVSSAALLGVGIPFTIVYGRKQPAEPASAVIIEPRIGAGSASLSVTF
jgi:hypothetical protein